jgi:hypothetical protein
MVAAKKHVPIVKKRMSPPIFHELDSPPWRSDDFAQDGDDSTTAAWRQRMVVA